MTVSRAFANVLTDDIATSRDFYVELLGLTVAFDSDWFVNLTSGALDLEGGHGTPAAELGIWRRDHELVPAGFRQRPGGVMLTFIVDDVDAVHAAARQRGVTIVTEPRNLFYGQRQLLLTDPNGAGRRLQPDRDVRGVHRRPRPGRHHSPPEPRPRLTTPLRPGAPSDP